MRLPVVPPPIRRALLVPTLPLLALAVAAAPAGAAAPAPRHVPDIETFMQIGASASPAVTRDGRTTFFIGNASGVNQIYRLDDENRWPYQLTVFTEGVSFFTLSPDGTAIICGVAWGGNENTQLWRLDATTGAATSLTDSPEIRYENPVWLPDGSAILFRSNEKTGENQGDDFYIWRMDPATGAKTLLAPMAGWNQPGDVSDDGTRAVVEHWDSNANSNLHLLDLATGRTTLLTPHEGEATYGSAAFAPDGKTLYLVSNANEDGINRRATLDLATKRIEFLDAGSPWEVSALALSPDRAILGWTVNEDGYVRLRLRDLAGDRDLPAPPVDGLVGGFSFTADRRVAFGFSSAVSTDDVWLWDWRAPELRKLTHSTYAGIDPTLFSPPTLVRYASFDGTEIPAFLYLPPGRRPGQPVPFIIHVHGGPEAQFQPAFIRHFQYLMLNGYGILAPNVRGSSGYGKAYMDMDNYKRRLDSVADLKAGADWLVKEGYTAPGMLAVKGGSYGGYMTLAAITEYPDLFSAAIDEVGIASFRSFLERTAGYRRALREAEYGPLGDPEFLDSISPLTKADLIRTPLLVVHGENDPRVPVYEARQIASAIAANGGVVDTLIFPDEGHGVGKRANALVLYRRMVEFLDRNLKEKTAGTR